MSTPAKDYSLAELMIVAGAEAFRNTRLDHNKGEIALLVGGMPYKCPAAPYEAAMLLESDYRKRGIRNKVNISLYTPEPGPLPVAGAQVSAQVRQLIESKGIAYYPNKSIQQVDAKNKQLIFNDGETNPFDLLLYVPPHQVPQVVIDSGIVKQGAWLSVDPQTLESNFKGVYAIGDITGIPLKMGKPLPKAGVFAHGQAEVVADNLVQRITNKGVVRSFDGHGECFLETGDGKAGLGSGNFFAEPTPQFKLVNPGRLLHFAKVLYEKYWLQIRLQLLK